MFLLLISAAITVFLLATGVIIMVSGRESVDVRLMEVAARQPAAASTPGEGRATGLGGLATGFTSIFRPARDFIAGNDEDLTYRLTLAGFRKPEHVEVYAAAKMLLPILALVGATFAGGNMLAGGLI